MRDDWTLIPNDVCHLKRTDRKHSLVEADIEVRDGSFIVKAGCRCLPIKDSIWMSEARKNAPIVDGVLTKNYETSAPSTAVWVVLGHSVNGWIIWRDSADKTIDRYKKEQARLVV